MSFQGVSAEIEEAPSIIKLELFQVAVSATAPVVTNLTPSSVLRVNSFRVATTGSSGKPAGNISLTNVGGTVTYSYITAGFTRARNSLYTVPLGKTFYMTSIGASIAGTKYARIIGKSSYNPSNDIASTSGIYFMPFQEVIMLNNSIYKQLEIPLKFPEKFTPPLPAGVEHVNLFGTPAASYVKY